MAQNFQKLYDEALAAGKAAGQDCQPYPMNVYEAGIDGKPIQGGKTYHVPEGVCGFAWVKVSPGNCALANWLKKKGLARTAYNGGVDIWISDYNQSMDRKENHANAMAKVFRDAGFKAYAESRMD